MLATLNEIQGFGRIDAESEAELADCFIRTGAYGRIERRQHPIVVGRKGTGKTAIYRALLARPEALVSGLRFEDYPWAVHETAPQPAAASLERYITTWKYRILAELGRLVVLDDRPSGPRALEAEATAGALTRFLGAGSDEHDSRARESFAHREQALPVPGRRASDVSFEWNRDGLVPHPLAGRLHEANRWLERCLEQLLAPDTSYAVLFDDLDRGYDPGDREYRARLTGLLLATREIHAWARERGLAASPIVFLRSDVYDGLSFPDKNKLTENLLETLTWTDERVGENSLKTLMDRRIVSILDSRAADPWAKVFDDALMRGPQTKFEHISARTYLRPRDMIQFCNLCLDVARGRGEGRISNESVAEARPRYSLFLLQELDDEIHDVAPEWRRWLDVLRRVRTHRFSRAAFEDAYADLDLEAELDLSADAVLSLLYRFGIIGFAKAGGVRRPGLADAWSYKDPTIGFDRRAPSYVVHPGLTEVLELSEAREEREEVTAGIEVGVDASQRRARRANRIGGLGEGK